MLKFLLLALCHLPRTAEVGETASAETEKTRKSIVPTKYGNKYKDGGTDDLAKFINTQCTGKDGFEFPSFFQLCRANGLDEAKVAHYEGLVIDNAHGAHGRARMTLRNMLASKARKGDLVGLDGSSHSIAVAAAVVPVAPVAPAETAETAPDATTSDGEDA